MHDKSKLELDRAAGDFVGVAVRLTESVQRVTAAAVTLGKAGLELGAQILRPITPVLDAGTLILTGCCDAYDYAADRLHAYASHLVLGAEAVQIVHDREGDPTWAEIGEAIQAAEARVGEPLKIAEPAADVAPSRLVILSMPTAGRWPTPAELEQREVVERALAAGGLDLDGHDAGAGSMAISVLLPWPQAERPN